MMDKTLQSEKLKNVNYEIRGPVLDYANLLEEEGQQAAAGPAACRGLRCRRARRDALGVRYF